MRKDRYFMNLFHYYDKRTGPFRSLTTLIKMMGNTFIKVRAYKELLNGTILEPFIRDGQDGD